MKQLKDGLFSYNSSSKQFFFNSENQFKINRCIHCFITMLTHKYASCVLVCQTLYVSSLMVGTGVFSSSLTLYKVTRSLMYG